MPVMNGYEAAAEIRKFAAEIPIGRRHGLRLRLRRAEDHAERIHGLHAQADQRPAAQKTDSRHPAGTHHADMKR